MKLVRSSKKSGAIYGIIAVNLLIEAILFVMAVASANGNVIPGIVARSLMMLCASIV
jgi:hypothetical protein